MCDAKLSVSQHDGSANVERHYALGRLSRDLVYVQPDERTAYVGDEGAYIGCRSMGVKLPDERRDLGAGGRLRCGVAATSR